MHAKNRGRVASGELAGLSNGELLAAYRQALSSYEAAKTGHGDRVEAFVQFLSVERALSNRLSIATDILRMFADRSQGLSEESNLHRSPAA